jgi:hypothetical protein
MRIQEPGNPQNGEVYSSFQHTAAQLATKIQTFLQRIKLITLRCVKNISDGQITEHDCLFYVQCTQDLDRLFYLITL